jgi:CheY-like chemotaxis protein
MNGLEPRPVDFINKKDEPSRYILVANSDANTLFYTATLLRRFDYFISMATTSREAFEMIAVALPSLIIIAKTIGDMSGFDFMEELRKNATTREVPFIAITHAGDLLETQHFLELGAAECIHLPLSPEDLYQAVQRTIETTPRTHLHVRTFLPLKVNNVSLDCPEGVCTTDLSELGMFVRMKDPYDVGTRLVAEIELNGHSTAVEAVVIYSYRTNDGPYHEPGMGLEFVKITPQDQGLIRQFIRDKVTLGNGSMKT